jgi:DinB superfamily
MPLDRETIESLRRLPEQLQELARRIPADRRTRAPAAGGFSLVEHVCHLRDFEAEGVQLRIGRCVKESEPDLADFPGDVVAAERNYIAQDFDGALQSFEGSREKTLTLLAHLSDEQLERGARFGGEGRLTLRRLIAMFAEHDRSHRQELAQLAVELASGEAENLQGPVDRG